MASCVLADGVKLNVHIDAAHADAPWVVFGNSLMTDLSIWDGQVSMLTGQWNILRYDQRGHGSSDVPISPLGFDTLSQDLLAVIESARIKRCTYIGLSMGVPTGLAAFHAKPDLFERMIFVDGLARSAATNNAFWEERIAFARSEGMDALAGQTVTRWLRRSPVDPAIAARLKRMIAATPVDGFTACASALRQYDASAALQALDIPTHFIAGAEDGALPQTMKALADEVSGATYEEIDHAGHVPNFEAPAEFNEVLARLLRSRGEKS